ncbi:hypothetical protein HDV01_001807 [Terramyces sp. JEL0728]|nr:hypothetical protein HDV01_001807 [Terramyces sp. JEL0728]
MTNQGKRRDSKRKGYNWIWKQPKPEVDAAKSESTLGERSISSVRISPDSKQSRRSISFVQDQKYNIGASSKSTDNLSIGRRSIMKSKSLVAPKHNRKSTSNSGRKTSFSQDQYYITGDFPSNSKTFTENLYASFQYYIEIYGIELVQACGSKHPDEYIDMDHYGLSFVDINWEAYGLKYHYDEFLNYLFVLYTQKQLDEFEKLV